MTICLLPSARRADPSVKGRKFLHRVGTRANCPRYSFLTIASSRSHISAYRLFERSGETARSTSIISTVYFWAQEGFRPRDPHCRHPSVSKVLILQIPKKTVDKSLDRNEISLLQFLNFLFKSVTTNLSLSP